VMLKVVSTFELVRDAGPLLKYTTVFAYSGYVLTEDGNKNCLKRVGNTATMIKCDKGYSGLSLQCKVPAYSFYIFDPDLLHPCSCY
jgi:hypothetical protein